MHRVIHRVLISIKVLKNEWEIEEVIEGRDTRGVEDGEIVEWARLDIFEGLEEVPD